MRSHTVLLVPAVQQLRLGRLHFVVSGEKKAHNFVVCDMWRDTIGSNRTGFWWYKQVIVLIRPRYSKHMQYFSASVQFLSMR